MDSLQLVRKLGAHKLQGLGWTNLNTLGAPLSILFAQVADHSEIMVRGKKAGNLSRTGFPTLPASRTQATILINGTDFGKTNGIVTNVPAGEQNLTLVKEGYQPKTVMVNVPYGGVKMLAPITLNKGTPAGPEP